jgi:hypothetical protein
MNYKKYRRDRLFTADGSLRLAWGLRRDCPAVDPSDQVVFLYSLRPTKTNPEPMLEYADSTHEVLVCEVAADTPIDFERSLWEQPRLSPMIPALVNHQLRGLDDGAAEALIQRLIIQAGDAIESLAHIAHQAPAPL